MDKIKKYSDVVTKSIFKVIHVEDNLKDNESLDIVDNMNSTYQTEVVYINGFLFTLSSFNKSVLELSKKGGIRNYVNASHMLYNKLRIDTEKYKEFYIEYDIEFNVVILDSVYSLHVIGFVNKNVKNEEK